MFGVMKHAEIHPGTVNIRARLSRKSRSASIAGDQQQEHAEKGKYAVVHAPTVPHDYEGLVNVTSKSGRAPNP